jgi:hypothetical protein
LIELNQANRGDLVRSPTREKLALFLERLQENQSSTDDATSLWYFLTIHDSILHPLVSFLKWKTVREEREKGHSQAQKQQADDEKRRSFVDTEEQESKRPKLSSTGTASTPT